MADLALAGTVIASHYAEPLARRTSGRTSLAEEPSQSALEIGMLEPGEPFLMLDDSLGWAWGYAGAERRVGYIPSACVEA